MAYTVEQLLVEESGRIGPDLLQRNLNVSPWISLVKRSNWADELGHTVSIMTYERSVPFDVDLNYDPSTWSDVTSNAADTANGGTCVPTAKTVEFAQKLRQYKLQQAALESPPICVEDLRFPLMRAKQLGAMMSTLSDQTKWLWVERSRDEYIRLAERKVVAAPSGGEGACPESASTFSATTATTKLTQGLLDRYAQTLIWEGAGDTALGKQDGAPVFTLILSNETSRSLIKDNADIRQDIRWNGDKVNDLLAPLGVNRTYGNFYHVIDAFPPRYNLTAGVWVRVYPFVGEATTKGNRAILNSAYSSATHEDTVIFHPEVYQFLIPAPITSPGGGTQFDPVDALGDWKWRNIPHRTDNPDGTIGFFRGRFIAGSEPLKPQFGVVIRHLRCNMPVAIQDCSS